MSVTTYQGWYLLDHHRNRHRSAGPAGEPNTRPWYTTRRRPVTAIVIHTPETLEDFTPPYEEAERVARYGATTTRASWHDTIDADSIIPMLPPNYTAWQTRGYNSHTVGMEIGSKASIWKRAPAEWVTGVINNAAYRGAQHAALLDIPPRFITRAQVDGGTKGFTSHAQLDPTRRTDPGPDFPWERYLDRVRFYLEGDDDPMTHLQARLELATAWHARTGRWMSSSASEDPQERLTRMAEQIRKGERTVADIVRFAPPLGSPPPNEPVPAWVLDREVPYSVLETGGGVTDHTHEAVVRLS